MLFKWKTSIERPTTLSNIGNKFVKNHWNENKYLGYQ